MRAKQAQIKQEEVHPILSPTHPFYMVGCNTIGPVIQSKKGNQYILVTVDYLTCWPVMVAVPNINEKTTANFLFQCLVKDFADRVLAFNHNSVSSTDLVQTGLRLWSPRRLGPALGHHHVSHPDHTQQSDLLQPLYASVWLQDEDTATVASFCPGFLGDGFAEGL
ncbi:hypothetical protein F4703DRAFT_1793655 [Phycomyces blakesleeanus]